jgi:hypothetical protein
VAAAWHGLHQLRGLSRWGQDLGVLSRILGHSDYATTSDVDAHMTPAMLERSNA